MNAGITAVIVVYNEERNLKGALLSLIPEGELDIPWEILVIDNNSSDGTKRVFHEIQAEHPGSTLKWISAGVNNLGRARALAVTLAAYPLVAFLDADCRAPRGWLKTLYERAGEHFSDPRVIGIGSGNAPPIEGERFHQALGIMLSSPLGNMNTAQAKVRHQVLDMHHLPTCNVCYRKETVLALGSFSGNFADVCEDLEFNLRARANGFRLIYLPGLEVAHLFSIGWIPWAKKMFRYGRGQIEVALLYPKHLLGVKGLPLLALIGGGAWIFISPLSAFLAGLTWMLLLILYSAVLCVVKGRIHLVGDVFFGFLITQVFYATGELWGLLKAGSGGTYAEMEQGKRQ